MNDGSRESRRWKRPWAPILVVLFIAAISAVAKADDLFRCEPGSTPGQIAKALLPAQSELAHMPVEIALPPSERSLVVLFRRANDVDTNYRGLVLVPEGPECSFRKHPLPPMDEAPTLFDIEVDAVFGASIESGKSRALVVLYHYHRNGAANNSGYASYVYGWNGREFETLPKLGEQVAGLATAAKVRARLLAAH